jgi:endoglucanase
MCVFLILVLVSSLAITSSTRTRDTSESLIERCLDLDEKKDINCDTWEDEEGPLPSVEDDATPESIILESIISKNDANEDNNDEIQYKAVSLSGGEFRDDDGDGEMVPDDNDALLFIYKGINTFRIPVLWENFAEKDGTLKNNGYISRLTTLIGNLTAKKATVILVLYNSMLYRAPGGLRERILCVDPSGRRCSEMPQEADIRRLWFSIVRKYRSPRMIWSVMNEDRSVTVSPIREYNKIAVSAIRAIEEEEGLTPRLILISGIQATDGLLSWVRRTNYFILEGFSDPGNNTAIDVHQYFDRDNAGLYTLGDCFSTPGSRAIFDSIFDSFIITVRGAGLKVFIGEIGIPDTPNCISEMAHFLDRVTDERYDETTAHPYGFIGWSLWFGGKPFGSGLSPLGLSSGSRANSLLWNNTLYQKYTKQFSKALPLFNEDIREARRAIEIRNRLNSSLLYFDGYVPFEFAGALSIPAGGVGYLYSNTRVSTPLVQNANLRIRFLLASNNNTLITVGLFYSDNLQGYEVGYSVLNLDTTQPRVRLSPVDTSDCTIVPIGQYGLEDESRCYELR